MKRFVKRYILQGLEDQYWNILGGRLRNPRVIIDPGAVLFVCKGNVCRSPYSQHAAPRFFPAAGRKPIRFESAGMDVEVPSSPPDTALTAAAMRGVDMGAHRSQPIHPGSLAGFDMVIAMEAAQSRWLKRRYPEHAGKVFLLPLFDPRSLEEGMRRKALFNIEDPFGKTLEAYLGCYERIERCLEMAGRQLDRNRCK